MLGTPSGYVGESDFRQFLLAAQFQDGRVRDYTAQGQPEKVQQVQEEHGPLLGMLDTLSERNREQKALAERIDLLSDMPASREGRQALLADLERTAQLPYRLRKVSEDELAQRIADVRGSLDMSGDQVEQFIQGLEQQREQLIKTSNKEVREVTGLPDRPMPR